ncbi:F-box/FBD/LRR-repeat protein At5g22660 [Brachypodium distachyon]|uniref:F-box domain-containing protein n=1 Tax=Brachypodium distachyon TaxID=15368 RepID=A0A2K2CPK0_BRADI|nr:F-box/FBD/LRR-repeat protein At5g22660 [Brachypodium distachyon]PNT63967.1 hypothetical protein BRADI_4g22946v3 [Brachypodium distachyon]|eukprot:XP_010239239.1 F-box/FBD/LRR-repeat protein At5g22660 [Brachypodium distachyon]
MFDGSIAKKASMSSGDDRISALPDGVLEHILGFLPAESAVQTSVLARRWRHVWTFMRRLNIYSKTSVNDSKDFIYPLLLLRDNKSTLGEVRFHFRGFIEAVHINMWIRQALLCQSKVLVVTFTILDRPLISRHLRKLVLFAILLIGNILDFASCPALEDLRISLCTFFVDKISSKSVKRLSIYHGKSRCDFRTRISIPSLVWLQIDHLDGKAPLLESMPLLETAFVNISSQAEYCERGS